MKRFLAVLAVVAIGAVVYVAAAPAGPQAAGPTAKQFAALKKQVTTLQKQVKSLTGDVNGLDGFVGTCMVHAPLAVDRVGSSTAGYLFGASESTTPTGTTATTALDLAPPAETTPQYRLYQVNTSDSACVSIANSAASHASSHMSAFA